MKELVVQAKTQAFLIGAKTSDPGKLVEVITSDVAKWIMYGATGLATVQFMLAMISFMSKEPQKQSQAKDHALHACIGLIGVFTASTIVTYLKGQAESWSALSQIIQTFIA